jgi:hypothetical protein
VFVLEELKARVCGQFQWPQLKHSGCFAARVRLTAAESALLMSEIRSHRHAIKPPPQFANKKKIKSEKMHACACALKPSALLRQHTQLSKIHA